MDWLQADNVQDELVTLVDQVAEQAHSRRMLQKALGDAKLRPLQGAGPQDAMEKVWQGAEL